MNLIWLLLGVGLLYIGGEGLVRGAAAFGRRHGLSPMVIGLTIVSVGTSSPELAASLAGVFKGAPAVSLGNIVGSNIANLGLVLGLTAFIWPLTVAARFIRREVPFMLLTSALMFLLVRDEVVGRLEGALLLAILIVYLRSLLSSSEQSSIESEFAEAYGSGSTSAGWSLTAILVGIGLLVLGANALILGAVGVARMMGVSERVIGLTIVAFGTSLPELASSVVAAIRREGDIVLGNLIGSNIFNILFILGATAAIRPVPVMGESFWVDLIAMMVVSLIAWALLHTGRRLARAEGALLMTFYCAYVIYLFV